MSRLALSLPSLTNERQLSFDGSLHTADLLRDLGVRVPFHFPHGDRTKRVVTEPVQQRAALFAHQGSELGRGVHIDRACESILTRTVGHERRDLNDSTAAAFLSHLPPGNSRGLPACDHEQNLPEVVAVVELREAALLGPATETVELAQGDILLVGRGAGGGSELSPRQPDEFREVSLLQSAGGLGITGLDPTEPFRHAIVLGIGIH